jgi:PAS domain S-box-containing protein
MLSDRDILDVLTQSEDATAIYDSADLNIRFINEGMLNLWGKDACVLGKTFEKALPEIKGQPFTDLLKNVWHTGEIYRGTDTPATLIIDGTPKTSFFDFEFRAIRDNAGKTIAILHTATDVSSRVFALQKVAENKKREQELMDELSVSNEEIKTARQHLLAIDSDLRSSNADIARLTDRLQESRTDFKRLVAQAPVAILVLRGTDMVIDLANAQMLEIIDRDSTIIGHPLLEMLPELKNEPVITKLSEAFETGKESYGTELPVRLMRNGRLETCYFNCSYSPLREGKNITGVMDIAVEVTDLVMARKRLEAIISEKTVLEQTLQSNQQRLQYILDTMAEGAVITDTAGEIIYVNPMGQNILGLTEEQILGRSYTDTKWRSERLDGSPVPEEDHPMYIALRTGLAVFDQEIAVVIEGREKVYISVNAAPLLDDENNVSGGIVTFTDVTNRRKILQEKDDFISVASHELKTPIASLKAALQLLERMHHNISPEMLAKLVTQSNKSMKKLTDLVESLLNSNRISQGRFPIHKTRFKIGDLIHECCHHIRHAGNHVIKFEGDQHLEVHADEQLIDQVVVNLVNNAVKYAPASKDIIISAQHDGEFAKISVTDFGPGIPADKLPYIFHRYYRADNNTRFSGLGLGLYICSEIIEKHGGEMGVESKLGQGSTFWFTLPMATDDQK